MASVSGGLVMIGGFADCLMMDLEVLATFTIESVRMPQTSRDPHRVQRQGEYPVIATIAHIGIQRHSAALPQPKLRKVVSVFVRLVVF